MTDSQHLLAKYSENGSDATFRELVSRYVDLVYSTALRLVEGDKHRAEDVTQTVFVNLARKARTLPWDVKLGGWLHRDTCLVAGHTLRGERRRQSRERQAAEMNALQNQSAADFSQVAPLPDDAINELEEADRTAILLRFFEQQDFRAVGQALGSNEDAARMRVTRALEKLEEFLKRRGVTTSAASLRVVLAANAVQAVPVGLVVTISTAAALAGATLTTTATATTIKAVAMTTLQKTIIGLTLVAAVGFGISKSRKFFLTPSTAIIPIIADGTPEPFRPATVETAPSQLAEATTSPGNPRPSLTARELYERAQDHLRGNRHAEALADLAKSLELLEQGIGRWQWAPTAGASPKVHLFDSLVAAYFSRAGMFAGKKDYASAIADLTRLLEFEPKYYSARFNRARYFTELGQTDAALADYTAIVDDPEADFSSNVQPKEKCLASAYEYRGLVFEGRKEYEKAVADFTESLRMDPSGGDGMIVYWRRGLLYQRLQQIDKALEDANQLSQWALQWAIASDSKESDRDRAFTAARFGSEILKHQLPFQLEVIAATRAKVGDFTEAVREQESAIKLLTPATENQRRAMQARLDLYKAGKPLASKP